MNLTFLQRNLLLDVFSNLESIICEAQLIDSRIKKYKTKWLLHILMSFSEIGTSVNQ